jgi:beta-xylosidase
MLTIDGLPKASYHAFSFMNRMRGQRYAVALPDGLKPTQNCIVTDELSATRALIWNTWFPFQEEATPWEVELALPVPSSHARQSEIRLTIAQVKKGCGSAFECWQAMGAPPNLSRIEQDVLAVAAQPDFTSRMVPVVDGKVAVSLRLDINEFALIEIGGDAAGKLATISHEQSALDQALMLD